MTLKLHPDARARMEMLVDPDMEIESQEEPDGTNPPPGRGDTDAELTVS
ncbi:MAG: hypothetical protein VX346_24360 [Planctomycetota bacterium]|nr:hypothetical protein [Planctomycetota bacterium]